jgi:hypothetical protein
VNRRWIRRRSDPGAAYLSAAATRGIGSNPRMLGTRQSIRARMAPARMTAPRRLRRARAVALAASLRRCYHRGMHPGTSDRSGAMVSLAASGHTALSGRGAGRPLRDDYRAQVPHRSPSSLGRTRDRAPPDSADRAYGACSGAPSPARIWSGRRPPTCASSPSARASCTSRGSALGYLWATRAKRLEPGWSRANQAPTIRPTQQGSRS